MQLDLAADFPCRIGHIYAASGSQTCENPRYSPEERNDWALDWCLVEVDQPKTISCRLPAVMPSRVHYVPREAQVTQYC